MKGLFSYIKLLFKFVVEIIIIMTTKETVDEFTQRVLAESKVDIDIEYCKKHSIKYKNHEIDAAGVDLFNTKSNKAAFDFLLKSR